MSMRECRKLLDLEYHCNHSSNPLHIAKCRQKKAHDDYIKKGYNDKKVHAGAYKDVKGKGRAK